MKTIHDPRYAKVVAHLKDMRKSRKITQQELTNKLDRAMSYIAKVENKERRLDVLELKDWLEAMDCNLSDFLSEIGWIE